MSSVLYGAATAAAAVVAVVCGFWIGRSRAHRAISRRALQSYLDNRRVLAARAEYD